jgi:hypothetical protein
VRWLLVFLLGAQELCQHMIITSLAHRKIKFVPIQADNASAPATFDDLTKVPGEEIIVRRHLFEL